MSIAGLVALSAVCDTVMPDGEMKKYIKPILGFILIITIIRPISGGLFENLSFELPADYNEISIQARQVEMMGVKEIYEEKLEKKAEEYLKNGFNLDTSVEICASDNEENFGEITKIRIGTGNVPPDIIQKLATEFGVKPEIVEQGGEVD